MQKKRPSFSSPIGDYSIHQDKKIITAIKYLSIKRILFVFIEILQNKYNITD